MPREETFDKPGTLFLRSGKMEPSGEGLDKLTNDFVVFDSAQTRMKFLVDVDVCPA